MLCSFSFFFAVSLRLVQSMFYCFDVAVAEFVPREVASFFGGYVELAVVKGFGGFLSYSIQFAEQPSVYQFQLYFFLCGSIVL